MPEALLAGLATPGLPWLLAAALLAGVVYGFAGFGAALIFMPLSVIFVDPAFAVAAFALAATGSVVSVLPEALREADRQATGVMLAAAALALPVGVWVLRSTDPVPLRYAVSTVVLVTWLALVTGWRYRQRPGLAAWIGVGGGVGFLGGSVGLNGPALVLFQLAGQDSAARSRANSIVVLTLSSLGILVAMALQGAVPPGAVAAGLLMLPVYAAGGLIGRRLFDPAREGLYRRVAYVIIGAAGIAGLPVFA